MRVVNWLVTFCSTAVRYRRRPYWWIQDCILDAKNFRVGTYLVFNNSQSTNARIMRKAIDFKLQIGIQLIFIKKINLFIANACYIRLYFKL